MYISEPVLSYSYLSKGVDEAWVLHKYPYSYLSTDCEYLCHLCIPWPLLPDFLEPLIKLAKPPSISLNFNPLKCTGWRLTDGLVVTLPRLLSVFPVSGHCAKLSRGRHLRFPIATFRPIPTPLSARSVRAHASLWAWTWASHPRPTQRSSWVRMTSFIRDTLCYWSFTLEEYLQKKKKSALCPFTMGSCVPCLPFRYQEELWSSHIGFKSTKETRDGVGYDDPTEDEACSREWLWDR